MTAPGQPETTSDPPEEEQEILLRLSDILPRVPPHLLKPGPHDVSAQVRFSVDELAEKIARGRVSVPLERLASVCPEVFREISAFPGEQEIPLPLQKLLEQVGLSARKRWSANGLPGDQLLRARTEASRIIETNASAPPPEFREAPPVHSVRMSKAISTARQFFGLFGRSNTPPAQSPPREGTQSPKQDTKQAGAEDTTQTKAGDTTQSKAEGTPQSKAEDTPQSKAEDTPQSKAGDATPSTKQDVVVGQLVEEPPILTEKQAPTAARDTTPSEPPPSVAPPPKAHPPVHPKPPAQSRRKPAPPPAPPGYISLRVLPIFRLLPAQVVRSETSMPEEARVALPLSAIDSQLVGGHVEIPLEDFIKALPGELRDSLIPIPETQVWIPLDEIFQNLPANHLFYMPPIEAFDEPEPAPEPAPVEESPSSEAIPELKEPAPPAEPAQEPGAKSDIEPAAVEAVSPTPSPSLEATAEIENSPEPAAGESIPEATAAPASAESISVPPAQETVSTVEETIPEVAAVSVVAESVPIPAPPETVSSAEETISEAIASPAAESGSLLAVPENLGSSEEALPEAALPAAPEESIPTPLIPETVSNAQETNGEVGSGLDFESHSATPPPMPANRPPAEEGSAPPPSRAAWMRGFQVPPPRLFSSSKPGSDVALQPAPAEPPPPPAATPEAKRTADFLAGQPGIFASAAFVQGAVFASEDFPRKPDLDALRDFMGVFIDNARESGRRLAWNRVLTLACDQFHLTAVVRDSHFIVALHHDRVLTSVTYDALIAAADDLSKAAG